MTDLATLMRDSAEHVPTSPPPYAAIRRQAQRRRAVRWVAAAAAAVLVAGGAAVALDGPTRTPAASGPPAGDVPLLIPTSAWTPGQPSDDALVTGRLRLTDEERCLRLGDRVVVWPKDWSAEVHADGGVTLYDDRGRVVGNDGDILTFSGGDGARASWSGGVCFDGVTSPFFVQSRPLDVIVD